MSHTQNHVPPPDWQEGAEFGGLAKGGQGRGDHEIEEQGWQGLILLLALIAFAAAALLLGGR